MILKVHAECKQEEKHRFQWISGLVIQGTQTFDGQGITVLIVHVVDVRDLVEFYQRFAGGVGHDVEGEDLRIRIIHLVLGNRGQSVEFGFFHSDCDGRVRQWISDW